MGEWSGNMSDYALPWTNVNVATGFVLYVNFLNCITYTIWQF